jgi:hypothetical protein
MIAVHGVDTGYPERAVTSIDVSELLAEEDRVVATAVDE